MTHGSLFSGIGGFDLAAEWMGWENVFHCENNPFSRRHLKYYWPNAISYHDITKTDFNVHRGTIDILTGGFPCQPYSQAGKRLGKEDERHLWPHMLRAIREIQPAWVVGENVLGLVNWSGGLVFEEVCADLEAEGYEVQPYVLPAASTGAPHQRQRVWFVAHAKSNDHRKQRGKDNGRGENVSGRETKIWVESARHGESWHAADADATQNTISNGRILGESIKEGADIRQQRNAGTGDTERVRGKEMAGVTANTNGNGQHGSDRQHEKQSSQGGEYALGNVEQGNGDGDAADTVRQRFQRRSDINRRKEHNCGWSGNGVNIGTECENNSRHTKIDFINFPTVSPICNGDDGLSNRLDGITFSKWRQESIKGGGNAVVPQVVHAIFKTIEDYEQHQQSNTMGH